MFRNRCTIANVEDRRVSFSRTAHYEVRSRSFAAPFRVEAFFITLATWWQTVNVSESIDEQRNKFITLTLFRMGVSSACHAIHCRTARLNLWLAQPMSRTPRMRAMLCFTEQLSPTMQSTLLNVLPYASSNFSTWSRWSWARIPLIPSASSQWFHGQHGLHRTFFTIFAHFHVCRRVANIVMWALCPPIKDNGKLRRRLSLDCFLHNTQELKNMTAQWLLCWNILQPCNVARVRTQASFFMTTNSIHLHASFSRSLIQMKYTGTVSVEVRSFWWSMYWSS